MPPSDRASGGSQRTYVGNDPVDRTDPTGEFCFFGIGKCDNDSDNNDPDNSKDKTQDQQKRQDQTKSVWRWLADKVENFFKPADLQKFEDEKKPDIKDPEELKKLLKEAAKDQAKQATMKVLEDLAKKAGVTDGQICEAEHCAGAYTRMSVCLMTYCGDELGLGGNDPAERPEN